VPGGAADLSARLGPFAADPARSVVIVDFDGTLAPIVADPPAARPLPEAAAVLARLVPHLGTVAVLSGRPVDFLRRHLPVEGLVLLGHYGVERVDGTGTATTAAGAAHWADVVRRVADDAEQRLPGLYVERKGRLAVALHWRRRPDLEAAAADLARHHAAAHGLRLEPGRQTVELRPPLDVDKGTATEGLAAGATAAMFVGDDRGDLAAFTTLCRLVEQGQLAHGLRVAVRSPEAPAELLDQADLTVDGPPGVVELLDRIAELVADRPAGRPSPAVDGRRGMEAGA
jgi:trehalose 6-phosphate phosphatase